MKLEEYYILAIIQEDFQVNTKINNKTLIEIIYERIKVKISINSIAIKFRYPIHNLCKKNYKYRGCLEMWQENLINV